MRWPFRRERPSEPSASIGAGAPAVVASVAVTPRAPGNAWAHLAPIAPPTVTPPLTFRGDRFGRSVIGARAMTTPPIPPLHHRGGRDAPGGILLDVASSPVIVAASRADVTAPVSVARLPPLTHRHLRPSAPAPYTDLLHSDLRATYTSFQPGRPSDAGGDLADLGEMSWDAEHGFRRAAPPSQFTMVRRRGPHGPQPAASTDDVPDAERQDEPATDASSDPAALRYVPAAGPRHERPPSDLVDVVRQATGVDVGTTTIDRSADVTARAAAMRAVAFTEGATVHLPLELGPHDEGTTRAVLAHELTHVAQRRTTGGVVPSESSPEGIELEHQARAVQRAVDDRAPVIPIFLRTAPAAATAPAGVQRLSSDEDRYDWQQRGAPPSQTGARAAFGFGFLQVDPDSAAGRAQTDHDRDWAEQFERDQATTLQQLRDRRYTEMVEEAERELQIQNLREERAGEDLLELERRDILALRRRLDQEMPWEFGPPASIDLYPAYPELRAEDPPPTTRPRVAPLTGGAARPHPSPTPASEGGSAPDAPTVGRDSVARRVAPTTLRHPTGGVHGPGASEPDVSWQHRSSTTREQIGAVFGGTFGQLLAGSVSDADDEAERRRAEEAPEIMQRRQRRERELRHAELHTLSMTARREERSDVVSLNVAAIGRIRAAVDREMPLEFVMPEYLDVHEDAMVDAEGNIVDLVESPPDGAGQRDGAGVETAVEPTPATAVATTPGPTTPGPVATAGPPADAAAEPANAVGADTATAAAAGTALALGVLATELLAEQSDGQDLAARVFDSATDLDLEKLARRLYGRFRRDLRRELLIDRERAGTLADAC